MGITPELNGREKSLIDTINPGKVLDIGCGNGIRLFSHLTDKKIQFVGMEKFERLFIYSPFKEKIFTADITDECSYADNRNLSNIDTITILGGSFNGIFSYEKQFIAWDNISRLIPVGGKIIFDVLKVNGFEQNETIGEVPLHPSAPPQFFLSEKELKQIWRDLNIEVVECFDEQVPAHFKVRYYHLVKK